MRHLIDHQFPHGRIWRVFHDARKTRSIMRTERCASESHAKVLRRRGRSKPHTQKMAACEEAKCAMSLLPKIRRITTERGPSSLPPPSTTAVEEAGAAGAQARRKTPSPRQQTAPMFECCYAVFECRSADMQKVRIISETSSVMPFSAPSSATRACQRYAAHRHARCRQPSQVPGNMSSWNPKSLPPALRPRRPARIVITTSPRRRRFRPARRTATGTAASPPRMAQCHPADRRISSVFSIRQQRQGETRETGLDTRMPSPSYNFLSSIAFPSCGTAPQLQSHHQLIHHLHSYPLFYA